MSGHFRLAESIRPKDGHTFLGPAVVEGMGGAHTGFELKGIESGASVFAEDVTIADVEVFGFTVRGIECWSGARILRVDVHDNGRNGIGCGLENGGALVVDSSIHHNGSVGELGRGGGGMKFARADDLLVRGNDVYLNIGIGVWCDVDCRRTDYRSNHAWGNTRSGLFVEVSLGPALIIGNTAEKNNCDPEFWTDADCPWQNPDGERVVTGFGPKSTEGGIKLVSTEHATIADNVLVGNAIWAITVRDDGRQYDAPFDASITGNALNGGQIDGCDIAGVTCSPET